MSGGADADSPQVFAWMPTLKLVAVLPVSELASFRTMNGFFTATALVNLVSGTTPLTSICDAAESKCARGSFAVHRFFMGGSTLNVRDA
jgi:hypothetical protein